MTGNELVRSALRAAGIIGAVETPTAEDYAHGIEAANLMLDTWATERLTIAAIAEVSTTADGAASYTVTTGGDFNTTTPANIDAAYYREGGTDYPLRPVDYVTWASIADKSSGGIPDYYWYRSGVISFWPVPASGTLVIGSWTPLTEITSGSAEMTLQRGAKEALKWNLALRLCPEYEREPSSLMAAMATRTLASLKRSNMRPARASSDLTPVAIHNILTDV